MKTSTLIAAICTVSVGLAGTAALARSAGAPGFDTLDLNGDGQITQSEMQQARTDRFANADANGDGVLDRAELEARARAQVETRIDRMMERMDTNGDGVLGASEMQPREDRSARMFGRLDSDGNGSISQAEFDTAREKMRQRHGGMMHKDGMRKAD